MGNCCSEDHFQVENNVIYSERKQDNNALVADPKFPLDQKHKTYDDLEADMRKDGIESVQIIVGFDFSASNNVIGLSTYGKPLHGTNYVNPYLHILRIIEPIIPKFNENNIYCAFRFGCADTSDLKVLPLAYPQCESFQFTGWPALEAAYLWAAKNVTLAGPTTFAHLIEQTIEIEKQLGGKQLLVLLIITDGAVSNRELDRKWIVEASKYPISIVAIGVGDGEFEEMEDFDHERVAKFDNFQFVNFTEFERRARRCETPDLAIATELFDKLPDDVLAMRRLGYL